MAHGNHLKHMLYGGVAIFAVLAVSGVPLGTALTYGVLLACPLMMLTMGGHSRAHGTGRSDANSDAAVHDGHRHEPDPVELERRSRPSACGGNDDDRRHATPPAPAR